MFQKSDKKRLYWLLDLYLSEKISARKFCDEFYYSYDLEIDDDSLTELESKIFNELSKVSSRFSEFELDHRECSKAFSTEEELRQKIINTKQSLIS